MKKIIVEAPKTEVSPEKWLHLRSFPPELKTSTALPPEGRKVIKLETDDLDEIPLTTPAAPAKSSQGHSVLERPAVSAEIKTPSFFYLFPDLIFQAGKSFKTLSVQMQKSMPLKLQSLIAVLIFLSLLIFIRFQTHPLTFSLLSSLTDFPSYFCFQPFYCTSWRSKVQGKSWNVRYHSFLSTGFSFHACYSYHTLGLTNTPLCRTLFILLKLWIFFKGFR